MAAPKLRAVIVPTPGPWLVRGEAGLDTAPAEAFRGVAPGIEGQKPGWPYFIRGASPVEGGARRPRIPIQGRPIASGILRLADAKLMATAPDLAAALLQLLIAPDLMRATLDPRTRQAIAVAWALLVRVAPHLEI